MAIRALAEIACAAKGGNCAGKHSPASPGSCDDCIVEQDREITGLRKGKTDGTTARYIFPRLNADVTRGTASNGPRRQRDRLASLLRENGISRLAEIRRAGINAATVWRLERRGSYPSLLAAPINSQKPLRKAIIALPRPRNGVPKGVICLVSALAYHGIADRMPRRVWIAIDPKDWKPQIEYPPLRIVRFADKILRDGVEVHEI